MKKMIIQENQKGFLFKNGKYVRLLCAGKYTLHSGMNAESLYLDAPVASAYCSVETLLTDPAVAAETVSVTVGDEQLALHYVNGQFKSALRGGKHVFWKTVDQHEFKLVELSEPRVDPSVPAYIFAKLPTNLYHKIEVEEYERARLYFDKKFVGILEAGTHYFWRTGVKVEVGFVDTRLTRMDIAGQELLTADKVTIRVSFVCNYRVTDCVRICTEIDDFKEQLHVGAQLALREYVGKYKLDEILENKDKMSEFVFSRLKEKEKALFVEIADAGVKDIILPGEIRDIMNTVLVAEKRAQANVITRREEVASTRSLLNTAKMMEENETLYKLKELEYVERICENVGTITLNGNGDLLTQLVSMLRKGSS